jgi:predicted RNA binding protein YcfA (HicA-like mRNA interferase family)
MPKLPAVRPREVARFLQGGGFVLDHSSGSHFIYYNPTSKRGAVIPQHNRDIPKARSSRFCGKRGYPGRVSAVLAKQVGSIGIRGHPKTWWMKALSGFIGFIGFIRLT